MVTEWNSGRLTSYTLTPLSLLTFLETDIFVIKHALLLSFSRKSHDNVMMLKVI